MPTSGLLSCSMEIGQSTARLREYGTTYSDRTVETYVAIPSKPTPFSIRVKSTGYIAPGLAVYVYIDSVYQTNRNKRGATREHGELEFHLGQKEDLLRDGRVIARGWWFEKLNIVEGKTKPTINEEVLDNLGVIEVVVLRCEDDPASIPKNPWTFPILPSIPPPARKVSSTGAAPGQSTRKTRASSSEADENGDDALGGMFGLFDGAGDEPPRRYRRHFGDIAEWSASVAPPSPARIYHSREPEIADDATRTSMVSSNGYHHMPGAFHSAESDAATHGAERDSADRYRSRTVHVRTLEGGLDYCYDREEPQQTRITSSPQARELRRGVSERAPGSPRPRHIGLRFESPQRYSRRDEVDQRIPRHAEDEKPFAAPTTRHRRKTVEIIDDQVDNHEKLLLRGRRKIDEHSGHEYVAPGRKTSGEFPNMQPQGKLKDGPELNYPAVDIHSPYGRVNVGYGSKYLAARDARRRDLEPKAQLQPPPWQPSIPPPPSHPARYIEEERADLINTEWRPTRSTSGPLYPAHRDTLYHPPAPPLSYIVPALIKPSNKARTTAKKIAKLEGQLHKLRADSAPLHLPYARCPSGWHQGYPVPGNGSMYHQHLNFAPSWHGGFSTRTQRSSSASSGTTRSAIDDVGEASKKDSGDDVAMVGGEISNNATNSNDDSNNNNQTSATSGWGQNTTNNDNSGSANQPINSGWQNQTDQNNDTPQQNGDWDSNNNQSNDNNASGNNDWNNTPDNNNQQQYSNQDWNNGQDDNNRDNNNNNGDNGWNSRQSGQNQDSTSEKSQDQKRSRAGSNIKDEEKPYTRSYWHAQVPTDRSRDRANSSRKRETFSMPEDPIYTISKDEAEARKLKHQVRGGRGTEKQNKLGAKPLYWDNLEAPYAVFRFKYRSKDMLKKILGEDIKESKEEYKEWLSALSKEQLVAEMLRKKEEGDSDGENGGEDKKTGEQAQDGNAGWNNSNDNGGMGDWNNNAGGDGGGSGGNDVAPPKSGW